LPAKWVGPFDRFITYTSFEYNVRDSIDHNHKVSSKYP
jgi:hypothetical protein